MYNFCCNLRFYFPLSFIEWAVKLAKSHNYIILFCKIIFSALLVFWVSKRYNWDWSCTMYNFCCNLRFYFLLSFIEWAVQLVKSHNYIILFCKIIFSALLVFRVSKWYNWDWNVDKIKIFSTVSWGPAEHFRSWLPLMRIYHYSLFMKCSYIYFLKSRTQNAHLNMDTHVCLSIRGLLTGIWMLILNSFTYWCNIIL